ncbi:hypothetical protein CK203_057102 [Vitis vinifera]|uniref:Retrovirus-related Pol polyprotein from transposon TNT 1-94-like beta-barrel domain-containing protein n=1 Tax=Vitis vinifera TaxID=29760 RepID=A0A438CTI5_VITVI|nr:hypothetical protein CK203_107392 [Vitis vinifera]RVW71715.1 hypothetical protein CK203_057102 [Vitis vinifera]
MMMALTAKNKVGFVDGTISCVAADDLLYNAWICCMVGVLAVGGSASIPNALIVGSKVIPSSATSYMDIHLDINPNFKIHQRMALLSSQLQRSSTASVKPQTQEDTGATHHMCCSLQLFKTFSPSHNSTVTLPNGHSVVVTRDRMQGKMIGMGRCSGNHYVLDPTNLFPIPSSVTTVCNNVSKIEHELWHFVSSTSSVTYPLSRVLDYGNLSSSHRALVHAISSHMEPTSFSQAIVISEWQQAMQVELQAVE